MTSSERVMRQAKREADVALWLPGEVPLLLRRIAPWTFRMGSRGVAPDEEPVHRVQITEPYYVGTFPVTQAEYRAVAVSAQELQLDPEPSEFKGDCGPVESVSWEEAVAWCGWIQKHWRDLRGTTKEGTELEIRSFGLLTEAQWEHACRAGTETEYYTGDGETALAEAGWYSGNSGGETHLVGEKKENQWGLYDMHGNVWEWCRDAWDEDAYKKREDGVADPEVTAKDLGQETPLRVLRGGAWFNRADGCRSSIRGWGRAAVRGRFFGFRVCLVRSPVAEPGGGEAGPGKAERGGTPQRSRTGLLTGRGKLMLEGCKTTGSACRVPEGEAGSVRRRLRMSPWALFSCSR
jgi:formylglycine-generating enzyme required for sulfatase activity